MGRNPKGTRKCFWAHCDHEDHMIDLKSESYIKDDKTNKCYHEKCWHEKLVLSDTINDFLNKVDPNASRTYLRKELNRLVYQEHVPCEYVQFIVNYVADHHMGLKFPGGIKFYLDNKQVVEAWNRKTMPKHNLKEFKVEAAAVDKGMVVPDIQAVVARPKMRELLRSKRK